MQNFHAINPSDVGALFGRCTVLQIHLYTSKFQNHIKSEAYIETDK